jgi:hypothetical protein
MKLLTLALTLSTSVMASETIYPSSRSSPTRAQSKQQAKPTAKPKDPCGYAPGTDPNQTLLPIVADIMFKETSTDNYNPQEALMWRRQIKLTAGMACYRYLQNEMGMGNSPLTGE